MKKTSLEEDRKRVIDMDRWYHLDGRDKKSHKRHGLFTGLSAIGKKLDSKAALEKRMSDAWDKIK
tara:strand:+ start:944 stop:1138 length:195 start_codon:yes stop_codon:yes gene_type:complete